MRIAVVCMIEERCKTKKHRELLLDWGLSWWHLPFCWEPGGCWQIDWLKTRAFSISSYPPRKSLTPPSQIRIYWTASKNTRRNPRNLYPKRNSSPTTYDLWGQCHFSRSKFISTGKLFRNTVLYCVNPWTAVLRIDNHTVFWASITIGFEVVLPQKRILSAGKPCSWEYLLFPLVPHRPKS